MSSGYHHPFIVLRRFQNKTRSPAALSFVVIFFRSATDITSKQVTTIPSGRVF
jgi:hypothetical protein